MIYHGPLFAHAAETVEVTSNETNKWRFIQMLEPKKVPNLYGRTQAQLPFGVVVHATNSIA
jgi:hypothetical protein